MWTSLILSALIQAFSVRQIVILSLCKLCLPDGGVVGEILTRASLELVGTACGLCISRRVWRCAIQAPSKKELVSHEVGETGCQGVSSTDSPQ